MIGGMGAEMGDTTIRNLFEEELECQPPSIPDSLAGDTPGDTPGQSPAQC